MGKRIGILVTGAALIALLAGPANASAASPWADEPTYSEQAVGKLKFGLTNLLLGWTELFRQPYQSSQYGENVLGGLGRGLWYGIADTLGGAAHTITFPLPQIDIPLPGGGTQILSSS
ncbi:MAG TPA: hypothetical protein VGB20_07755 [bacterium]